MDVDVDVDVSVSAFALSILDEPSLEAKLRAPPASLVFAGDDGGARAAIVRAAPARDASIALAVADKGTRLPPLSKLRDPRARAVCLSRFAHHELCAVELFAWALLAFPDMPQAMKRGFVQTLVEEQEHCRLYVARLAAHGFTFGAPSFPLTDYFWKHAAAIAKAPHGPLAFLCAMGLTLEQANLDFTLLFRDAFRAAGDEESAQVMQRVHDDEVGHVKLAVTWARKLASGDDVDAYRVHAPFPFSLARAKGRRFDAGARVKAGLSRELIEAVRVARPYPDA